MPMETPLRFGIFPTPDAAKADETRRLCRVADESGLDLVGIQDHPYQRRFLDTFALMAVVLADTRQITVFPDVANLPLRGAAMIAKASASLDVLFPGRFQLGLGAGGFRQAVEGMGGPRRSPGDAVNAFEEAVRVMRALWSGERGLHVEGDHYRLAGVHSGPVPSRRIDIWSGAGGPRMLELTGRLCDGWIPSSPYLPPEKLNDRHRRVDEGARQAGRDPAEIRRLYNVGGRIRRGPARGFLDGDQDHWVEELGRLAAESRIDTFVMMVPDEGGESQIRALAEVADELRSRGVNRAAWG